MNNSNIDPKSFEAIAKLAYMESGLQLVAEKTSMIQSRLRHRLNALGVDSFSKYAEFVCSNEGVVERRQMISALTTNVSHFFREQHHFDILTNTAIPDLIRSVENGQRLRIWSAGCSNGQEAYSIAIALLDKFPQLAELDFRILATDIDPQVVAFAKAGIYPKRMASNLSPEYLKRYFTETELNGEAAHCVNDSLKSKIVFKEMNLLSDWPIKNPMDIIFCRNVVIYFDLKTQNKLWPRFRSVLSETGYLFLGHSERITDPSICGFMNDGPTSYRPNIPSKTQ